MNDNNNGYVDASTLDNQTQTQQDQSFNSGVNYGASQGGQSNYYQQPAYQQPYVDPKNNEPVGIGTWLGILFLLCIPCVNIIMLFVWAFADGKESRKNFGKAYLIFIAIMIVLEIVLALVFGAALMAWLSDFSQYANYYNYY